MRRRSCCLYGFDGFDLDVVHNLVPFYRSLGLAPALSPRLVPADVLVIQRPPAQPVDVRGFDAVHVWDYVGNPIDDLIAESPGADRMTVFTASEARAAALRPAAERSGATIRVQVAPVRTATWRTRLADAPRYGTVHIGNYKPYYRDGEDAEAMRFFQVLRARHADVWGGGWDGAGLTAHGPLALFRVSAVYAATEVALGMMYPFQRSVSFSGRFWHAPLNGAVLLSEPSVYAGVWPGVRATDYTEDGVAAALEDRPVRAALQEEATAFWDEAWQRARERVGAVLDAMPPPRRGTAIIDLARSEARLLVHRVRR